MEKIFLDAEPRQEIGKDKVKALRVKGFIPAIVYTQGKEPLPVKVSHGELLRLVHQYRIEGVLINLKINDGKKHDSRSCLIKEIQHDPIHGDIIHVDFNEISLTKSIKVNVPVVAIGEPMGVKQEGGSLEHILWEIEVECLPTNIPKEIQVDVSPLKISDAVCVKDLKVPSDVKVLNDPDAVVLSVAAPMKEEVPAEAVEGEATQEPEVIKEKKETAAEGEEEGSKEKAKSKAEDKEKK
ncbi:MAG: 50S ribosomal protein L25 [Candidatus Omnitrophota bacterium]